MELQIKSLNNFGTVKEHGNLRLLIVSTVMISNDRKHDAAAVSYFLEFAYNYLKENNGIEPFLEWSDCCASQYRGNGSSLHISENGGKRHYFESSNGKNSAHGYSAIVKHMSLTRNVEEFYEYASQNMVNVGDSQIVR